MSDPHSSAFDPSDLPGSAALFPLPNAVFFPHVIFPLHIFEPRYRKMTADALAGNRLIAMAHLKPGWEELRDDAAAPIYDRVCLSRITAEEKLPDGRYYLVLQGLSRRAFSGRHARICRIASANWSIAGTFRRDFRKRRINVSANCCCDIFNR